MHMVGAALGAEHCSVLPSGVRIAPHVENALLLLTVYNSFDTKSTL
jgi:hypothetical protein